MKNIGIVLGTRPEAIKLAPVVNQLRQAECKGLVRLKVISTGQHREMLRQVFDFFGFQPDVDLDIMHQKQSLNSIASTVISRLENVLVSEKWDWVLVQGDTTTAAAAAWCASNLGCKVAHLEAGLRTGDKANPFPEETNRKIISAIADVHFAPTETAREALLREGVAATSVLVTGNTVIDALLWARERVSSGVSGLSKELAPIEAETKRIVLITGHRRESFGKGFEAICEAIKQLAKKHADVLFVYPVHLNPRVQEPVFAALSGEKNVRLISPLDYPSFVWLLNRSCIVLTDSGGVQEEAPSFGKPVLIMRETTERPEGLIAGNSRLVGVDTERIVNGVSVLLRDDAEYKKMAQVKNPYGDGFASDRVANALMA
jgi:UDP-N-acetylglucosamine 2-epimerase (non-hydrolysing)